MENLITAKFHDSEISKSQDYNYSANAVFNLMHVLFQGLLSDVENSCVLSGFDIIPATPPSMNVVVTPGMLYSRIENKTLYHSQNILVTVPASSVIADRIDIIEARYITESIDVESRAFKNPASGAISYSDVATKTLAEIEAHAVAGVPGAGVAPNASIGWTKIAEINVPAGTTAIISMNIKKITAEEDGAENTSWTLEKTSIFNLGSQESMKNTLLSHIRNNITELNTVHGIQQGHGNNFDSDKLDGLEGDYYASTYHYDLIIDSDAKLALWASSGTYEKVLIRAGTWTLPLGGVSLTARGTKCVVGESGSKLVFSSADKGLYYTSLPTTNDYSMRGVTIEGTARTSNDHYCFEYCTNLTECTGTATSYHYGSGFHECNNLIKCIGNSGGTSLSSGFYQCTNLYECIGSATTTGQSSSTSAGFRDCNTLIGCAGIGLNTGTPEGYGFSFCKKMIQNRANGASKTATYYKSYADAGTSYACADTPNGGFNS